MRQAQVLIGIVSMVILGCAVKTPKIGLVNGQLTPCPKTPNCVSSLAASKQQQITPITYNGTQREAQTRLMSILQARPRVKIVAQQKHYLAAEFTSMIFGFVDDVEFFITTTDSGMQAIHLRSASRVGYYDFAANRNRIEQIRKAFHTESKN